MDEKLVFAAFAWPDNSYLIEDVARLGYLRKEWKTLDPTSGRLVWWKRWRPDDLITHDIDTDGVDFRDLPYPDGTFDAIAWDPAYVSVGGRTTTTIPDFHNRYGMTDAPKTPAQLQAMNDEGQEELCRVLKPKGIFLAKCQSYISSGKFWPGVYLTQKKAESLGFEFVDQFEHLSNGSRPQPERTRRDGKECIQMHARRNLSTLLVFRKK